MAEDSASNTSEGAVSSTTPATTTTTSTTARSMTFANRHIPKFLALHQLRCNHDENADNSTSLQSSSSSSSSFSLQVVTDGTQLTAENLIPNNDDDDDDDKASSSLSLSNPILVLDSPSSIGMRVAPLVVASGTKGQGAKSGDGNDNETEQQHPTTTVVEMKDICNIIGHDYPVNVIDVEHQEELEGWTLGDLVDYFEDDGEQQQQQQQEVYEERPIATTTEDDGTTATDATASSSTSTGVVHVSTAAAAATTTASSDGNSTSTTASGNNDSPPPRQRRRRRAAAAQALQKQQERLQHRRVLNQISLEFSLTPLRDMVSSPQFVRALDWIDQMWPSRSSSSSSSSSFEEKSTHDDDNDYPRVQYYCLTSTRGCYTDWHIDFGGSSVWYHLLRGEKMFALLPPTSENLAVYQDWLCRPNQAELFLVDLLDDKQRKNVLTVSLKASQTLVIPTGWIHAVYTPRDSIVVGGNFLHGLDISLQLQIHDLEDKTRVLDRFRFPHFVPLHFYAAGRYLSKLQDSSNDDRGVDAVVLCERELDGIQDLASALELWWKEKQADEAMVTAARYAAQSNGCETVEEMLTLLKLKLAQRRLLATTSKASAAATSEGKPKLRLKLSATSESSKRSTTAAEPSAGAVKSSLPPPRESKPEGIRRIKLSPPPRPQTSRLAAVGDMQSRSPKTSSSSIRLKLPPQLGKTKLHGNTDANASPSSEFRIVLDSSSARVTSLPKRRRSVQQREGLDEFIPATGDDEWEPESPKKRRSASLASNAGSRFTGNKPAAASSRHGATSSTSRQRLMKRLRR